MSPVPVTYDKRVSWSAGLGHHRNRPYGIIEIFSPHGSVRFQALFDTGADYLIFDDQVRASLGLDLSNCLSIPVEMADGRMHTAPLVDVEIEIEGYPRVPVQAVIAPVVEPLIGLSAIHAATKFGVDDLGWLCAQG